MDHIRMFQVSSDLFWGYRVEVNLSHFENLKDAIAYVKNDLKTFLSSRNLQFLLEKVEEVRFHVHSPYYTINNILELTTPDTIVYICDHCKL
jgi:hypothetical protein